MAAFGGSGWLSSRGSARSEPGTGRRDVFPSSAVGAGGVSTALGVGRGVRAAWTTPITPTPSAAPTTNALIVPALSEDAPEPSDTGPEAPSNPVPLDPEGSELPGLPGPGPGPSSGASSLQPRAAAPSGGRSRLPERTSSCSIEDAKLASSSQRLGSIIRHLLPAPEGPARAATIAPARRTPRERGAVESARFPRARPAPRRSHRP